MAHALNERNLYEAMVALLGDTNVLTGASVQRAYDCDSYTVDRSRPSVVVIPRSTSDVAAVVKWCHAHEVPFTPRGAGTGLSGGAMPALGGVVISLKGMTKILEIDLPNQRLRAETGVPNLQLTRAVESNGFHFAPDPSSQSVSTLGGNIAENSGGPHTLKYGVTSPHILGLTLVDEKGDIHVLGGGAPGRPGPNLVQLSVGTEGTTGIVTEAWIRLTPLPAAIETGLAHFSSVREATQTVSDIIAAGLIPAALEFMDRNILEALAAAFKFEFAEGAEALLLFECDGEPTSVAADTRAIFEICRKNNALRVDQAEDAAQRARLWMVRKKGIGAMGRLAPSIVTHDGVIPRSKLPETLEAVYEIAKRRNIGVANIFHAGDGNLHPCFYFDDRDPKQVEAVVEAGEEIIELCVRLGGSVTGEHGVGVEKQSLLGHMFTPADLEYQLKIKQIFAQGDLCNPCKVLPSAKGCLEHKARWRGVAT